MDEKKDKVVPKKPTMPAYMNFILAGFSGMAAITICQPTDLLKTRMQLLGTARKNNSMTGVALKILKNEGYLGFYVGISAALFSQATYTTSRIGSFNAMFDFYKNNYGNPNFPVKVMLGVMAGGFGAFIGTPAEVVLIRMTADNRLPPEQRRNYRHVFHALARITREEGITKLWRGAVVTVTRAMVVNGAVLGSYAQAREMLEPHLDGFRLHALSALIASLITTVVSMPLDLIKTRVQNTEKSASIIPVLTNVIKNEGVLALWSGMVPTYLNIGPMTILVFVILEQLNALYYKYAYYY